MKTPQQAAAKWDASTSQGQQTWVDNLTRTTKPIVAAAVAQRAVMQSNFNAATAPGGRWQSRLEAVGEIARGGPASPEVGVRVEGGFQKPAGLPHPFLVARKQQADQRRLSGADRKQGRHGFLWVDDASG